MKKLAKNSKGITLITLVITVIVIGILASVGTYSGIEVINSSKLTRFTTEMKLIQTKVNEIYDNRTEYELIGTDEYKEELSVILGLLDSEWGYGTETENYKYYAVTVLKDDLGIEDIEQSVFINLEKRKVISSNGIKADGTIYYVLEQLPNSLYNVDYVEREELQVGDYVNYTYDEAEDYVLKKEYSGYEEDQTILQTKDLKWRIINIDEENGTVDLISDIQTDNEVGFLGALGYNNGVYLINDICRKQYSNESLGVTARSINLEDLESKMNEEGIAARDEYKTAGAQYGKTKTYNDLIEYPTLYSKETGAGIGTTQVNRDGIGSSDEYYDGPTEETIDTCEPLTVTQTSYDMYATANLYFDDNNFYETIFKTECDLGSWWIASRSVFASTYNASWGLFSAGGGRNTNGSIGTESCLDNITTSGATSVKLFLRPIVTLKYEILNKYNEKIDGVWQIQ